MALDVYEGLVREIGSNRVLRGPEALEPYGRALIARFGPRPPSDPFRLLPAALRDWIGGRVLASRFWSRRLVVDRWFLHRQQPALAGA